MKRESNIELLRIIAMMMVLLVHCNYFSIGKVTPEDISAAPLDSFVKAFAQQVCIICVNVFILISGWFGIRPSLKGVASFLYQILFYHILISSVALSINGTISLKVLLAFFLQGSYWFIPAYLILYCMSPILNSFIENSPTRQYIAILGAFFLLELAFGWVSNAGLFQNGYSAISFVGLYLLAGFLRRYNKWHRKLSASKSFLLYMLFTIIPVAIYFLTKNYMQMLSYCSPFVIAASVFFFLTFEKMKVSSPFINTMGKSAFAIFLIHLHPAVVEHYKALMSWAYNLLGGAAYLFAAIAFALCFGLLCITVDQLRVLTWKPINEKIKALEEKYRLKL
jgi:surface polysaccharide O-acyltransferase-like enzyme